MSAIGNDSASAGQKQALDWLTVQRGPSPLILSLPHTGGTIPESLHRHLVSLPLALKDADCWIDRLYDFASGLGVTVVHTAISRTVIDVNRDPSGASLYPGQATTELCPTTTFDGEPLYRAGAEPNEDEIERRKQTYWVPYHDAIRGEIQRLRALHPRVVLYDGHSIRSVVPRLFDGELPNFNIGTNSGRSCDPSLQAVVGRTCGAAGFSQVSNGRFKGGWITRSFGRPEAGIHAVQMELACRSYMDETGSLPFGPYNPARAEPVRQVLRTLFVNMLDWAKADA